MVSVIDEPILKPVNPQSAYSVINSETGIAQEYKNLIKVSYKDIWMNSFYNELVRLSQGVGDRLPTGKGFFHPQVTGTQGIKIHVWPNYHENTIYESRNTSHPPNYGG